MIGIEECSRCLLFKRRDTSRLADPLGGWLLVHIIFLFHLRNHTLDGSIFAVLVVVIASIHILHLCEAKIGHIFQHHLQLFPRELASFADVKDREDALVEAVGSTKKSQWLQKINEWNWPALCSIVEILHKFVKTLAPDRWKRTKLEENVPVNALPMLWPEPKALVQLVNELQLFDVECVQNQFPGTGVLRQNSVKLF